MTRYIILTLLLAIPTLQARQEKQSTSVPMPEPIDLRPSPIDLSNGVEVHETINSGEVDVGAKRAAEMFTHLHDLMENGDGQQIHLEHFVLNVNPDTEDVNNKLLEKWRIGMNDDNTRNYSVTIKTTNVYDEENPSYSQTILYQCKFEDIVEHMVCIPDKCDLESFNATPTPGIVCAHNYRMSQRLLTTVFESSHKTDQTDMGEGIYESTIDCMKRKVETMSIGSTVECYYKGFEPNNIVSYEDMKRSLLDDGWKRLEDGTFRRETVVDEKSASAVVNNNDMTLTDSS